MFETRATAWFRRAFEFVGRGTSMQSIARNLGGLVVLAGVIILVLAPIIGGSLFTALWGVEPLTYIGAAVVIVGLGVTSLSYLIPNLVSAGKTGSAIDGGAADSWGQVTQHYFELFAHDLGRPLRRILGSERELRVALKSPGPGSAQAIEELLDEIERQAPKFRLMMSNIRVLVELEAPDAPIRREPVEPSTVVRNAVARYSSLVAESQKEITWWSEPPEFGIVYSDTSAIEHIVTNLVDNAVRLATTHIEVKVTKNPTHFFVRVWDDGPGIAPQYVQHVFDRGWTPEVARREEKPSSGLGLFIARTLANRQGGDLTVESVASPDTDHHSAFLLSLPLREA